MRLRARIDDNQRKIVEALRACGATVQSLAQIGSGVPDLLVGFKGKTFLLEVKDGSKSPSQRRLTPDEEKWANSWVGFPVVLVESIDDALVAIGVCKPEKKLPSQGKAKTQKSSLRKKHVPNGDTNQQFLPLPLSVDNANDLK